MEKAALISMIQASSAEKSPGKSLKATNSPASDHKYDTRERVLCQLRRSKSKRNGSAKVWKLLEDAAKKLKNVRCKRYMLRQLARMHYCLRCFPNELDNVYNIDWYNHSMTPKLYVEF